MKTCPYCGFKKDKNVCNSCLANFRYNYEALFVLIFLFSIPSIFMVKGTGNFLYLLSSFFGIFLYLFNIKIIRDDEVTYRYYESILAEQDEIENYLSGNIGIVELIHESKFIKLLLLRSKLINSEAYKMLVGFSSLVSKPSIDEQMAVFDVGKVELDEVVDERRRVVLNNIYEFKRNHSELIKRFK